MHAEAASDTIVFFENQFVPIAEARVGILTHALHYGTGVFEGIRGYWDADAHELYLFRPVDHYLRWKANCGILRLHVPMTAHELAEQTAEVCRRNAFQTDVYVRPIAYKSAQRIGVAPDDRDAFALVVVPYGVYLDSSRGLRAGVASWRRIEDNAIPGRGKICGAYVNSALAGDEARRNGYDEAIFLTESGHVAEGASGNLFMVRHGGLITPPPTDNILEGITRASVMDLARQEMHLETQERSIDRSELYIADEVFFTGTAVEVAPIVEVDRRPVGAGTIGPITAELRRIYTDAAHGRLARYRPWLFPVYQPRRVGKVA